MPVYDNKQHREQAPRINDIGSSSSQRPLLAQSGHGLVLRSLTFNLCWDLPDPASGP